MFPQLLFPNQLEPCIIILKGLKPTYIMKQKSWITGWKYNFRKNKYEANKPEAQTEGKQNRFWGETGSLVNLTDFHIIYIQKYKQLRRILGSISISTILLYGKTNVLIVL